MIDIIDPSLNLPQTQAAASVEPVEPIKADTVGIEEERLQDKHDREGAGKKSERETDTVELSQQEDDAAEEQRPEQDNQTNISDDDGSIDILI